MPKILQSRVVDAHVVFVLRYMHPQAPQPYATHRYDAASDTYFWGHYFRSEAEALADLRRRCHLLAEMRTAAPL